MECPRCGGGPIQKMISRTNFSLKGGGWYNEGYGSKAVKPGSTGDATTASSGEAPKKAETETSSTLASGCGTGGCGHKH
jgi:predicted nucleic acid-binding Zn ribbon protein